MTTLGLLNIAEYSTLKYFLSTRRDFELFSEKGSLPADVLWGSFVTHDDVIVISIKRPFNNPLSIFPVKLKFCLIIYIFQKRGFIVPFAYVRACSNIYRVKRWSEHRQQRKEKSCREKRRRDAQNTEEYPLRVGHWNCLHHYSKCETDLQMVCDAFRSNEKIYQTYDLKPRENADILLCSLAD